MIRDITRRTLTIRECKPEPRSSNFIPPAYGFGCLYKCAYCYMRRNVRSGVSFVTNPTDIADAIHEHALEQPWPKTPDQTHEKYYTYDISCDEDFILHWKHHEKRGHIASLQELLAKNDRVFLTMATKRDPREFVRAVQLERTRIRLSLMPEEFRRILEPNTSTIRERLGAITPIIQAGYECHLNFSPVIVVPGALDKYRELLQACNTLIPFQYRDQIKAEVIFLTHSADMHVKNLQEGNAEAEKLLWNPQLQEKKQSQFGGPVLRYQWQLKQSLIKDFKELLNNEVPWLKVRYIF